MNAKTEINDIFIHHFNNFQQTKKKKLKDIIDKRSKIDHN